MTGQDRGSADLLRVGWELAVDHLEAERRPWLIGMTRLVDVPEDTQFSARTARRVLDIARLTMQFPSGPFDFVSGGYRLSTRPDHRRVTLHNDDAPHLRSVFGFGAAGILTAAFSRGDLLDDGRRMPGAVVLSDLESVAVDTVILACGAAVALDYFGPIEVMFGVTPGQRLTYLAIDEIDGRLRVLRENVEAFTAVRGTLDYTQLTVPRDVHVFLNDLSKQAARQFGAEPQLTEMLPEDASDYRGPLLRTRLDGI